MGKIEVLHAQYDIPAGIALSVKDWGESNADGTDEDPYGIIIGFGADAADSGGLAVFIPDETVDRLLLALLEKAPRLSGRTLTRALGLIEDMRVESGQRQRERLDPGPLPVNA